jgi:hypothetical protein
MPGRSAGDAHQEVAEAVIKPLDVWQHAHGCVVLMVYEAVHASR